MGVLVAKDRTYFIGAILKKQIDWEGDEWDADADGPLDASEAVDVHRNEATKELSAKALNDENYEPDNDEGWIVENSFKYVHLVINLSGTNHVENLHEHE